MFSKQRYSERHGRIMANLPPQQTSKSASTDRVVVPQKQAWKRLRKCGQGSIHQVPRRAEEHMGFILLLQHAHEKLKHALIPEMSERPNPVQPLERALQLRRLFE